MYCPHCGQQQVTEVVRFCSRCGFPLDGVIYLLHNGGMLPAGLEGPTEISPRRRGVRQGGILLLVGAVLVPILGVFNAFSGGMFIEILTAIAAIICFLGGPLRMIYAGLFEEGAPRRIGPSYAPRATPLPSFPARNVGALPPPKANPTDNWRRHPTTGELAQPPSVTENTTRLLDKEEPREH
jgi:hypothetical protein